MSDSLTLHSLRGVPMIAEGDDLVVVINDALAVSNLLLQDNDILVLAQKIVSKAEGRTVDLRSVNPGPEAVELADATGKDPRVAELILAESTGIIRRSRGVIITEHRRGWIMANAGIDASNVASADGEENVLLLPEDPDATCADLRRRLGEAHGVEIGVIISDSFGRPWRLGTTAVAIGAVGLPSLWDRRGDRDLFDNELMVTQQAVADELANAASLLQGQAAEGRPVVLIRGLRIGNGNVPNRPAADLIRDPSEDLFR
ncbi:coenzyme F420-0:L-glutamate ligase [Roseovarius amoyensis]|uniref:coenzyme F420-0:L-glutamate ligase n=1 Tax=Roseovarius amoyensis TaxID=2211448 RepID=UPI000DBE0565|nr:coenzyme F420-0:L-glutamate ligase [Roseovarius amoyensis]